LSDHKKDIKRFFKHSYIYAVGNIINRLGAFLLLPVYTNYLTVAEYGIIELFYAISAVVFGFLSMGIAHATLRFYFEYENLKDRHEVVSTNYVSSFLVSIIGVSIVAFWHKELSELIFSSQEHSVGVLLILGTIVFELSSQICLAYVRAVEKSLFFVYLAIAKLLIQVSINVYLVIFADYGVVGVLIGNFMAVFIGWIILSIFTIRNCGLSVSFKKLVPIIQYSFPFLLGTFAEIISTNVDKFGLNYLESVGVVGIYMLAIKFSMIIEQLIGEPFSRSYGSFRFSIMKQDNAAEIQAKIVRYLFYAAMFCALGMSLLIKEVLMIMSDETFWGAANIVPIVVLASVIKIMNYPLQTGILYAKKTKYFFYIGLVTAVISVVANLSLIPIYGLLGACFALILTDSAITLLMHLISQKYFYVAYEYRKIALAFIFAVLIFGISTVLPEMPILLSIMIKMLLLLLFIGLLFFRNYLLNSEETQYLLKFIPFKRNKAILNEN